MCFLSQLVTGFSLCHFSLWQCSCFDFLKAIWFQNNIWRELSLNLLFFLHCARIFVTVKQTQSQPNPNLFLVKISHFLFPPILSKLSTTAQSALLDLICCCLSCNIPSLLNLDYTIKLHSFAFQSLSPSSKHNNIQNYENEQQLKKNWSPPALDVHVQRRSMYPHQKYKKLAISLQFCAHELFLFSLWFLFSGYLLWMRFFPLVCRLIHSSH